MRVTIKRIKRLYIRAGIILIPIHRSSIDVIRHEWIVGCGVRRGVVACALNYGGVVIGVSGCERGLVVISRVSNPLRLKSILEEIPRRSLRRIACLEGCRRAHTWI